MRKAFLFISAGMLSYLGPGGLAAASELPEEPITVPVSGSSSRSTSNSAGTTINQQNNTQDNNDQFHGFGPGIHCPTPTLGFSLYGGGGNGGGRPEGGVSASSFGGMITFNLPLGNRNRRTCAELGEAQLRAVQAQTERTQLEAAKVRTDINLVTIQQCLTILQTARLSGRFADACAGIGPGTSAMGLPAPAGAAPVSTVNPGPDSTPQAPTPVASTPDRPQVGPAPTPVARGLTPQFTSRSQPARGQTPPTPLQPPSHPDQLPPIARPRPIAVAPAAEEFATAPAPQDLPVITPPPDQPSRTVANPTRLASLPSIARVQPASPTSPARSTVGTAAAEEFVTPRAPQDLPVITPPPDQPSRTVANPTRLASLPSIARVQPASPTSPARSTAPTSRVAAPEKSGGVEFSTPPGNPNPAVGSQLAASP